MIKGQTTILLAILLNLPGCDNASRAPTKALKTTTQDVTIQKDVAAIEQGVRLAAANKRIDQLETEVENLKTNPQTLQLDLLKQRLEAVETKVYARDDDQPGQNKIAPAKPPPDRATSAVRPLVSAQRPPAVAEPKPVRKPVPFPAALRPATKAEAVAFAKGER